MKNKKLLSLLSAPILFASIYTPSSAHAQTNDTNQAIEEIKDQIAVDKAMETILEKTNEEIQAGKENINISQYVPEINQSVGIEFSVKDIPSKTKNLQNNILAYAAAPSGQKSYSGKVNAWGFTHTLRGTFAYSGGKVTSTTKEVLNSGITYSHSSSSSITKLDPSVWSVNSKSVHKWLGTVGNITGLGYTSYITIQLYGSGTSSLQKATYTTGA